MIVSATVIGLLGLVLRLSLRFRCFCRRRCFGGCLFGIDYSLCSGDKTDAEHLVKVLDKSELGCGGGPCLEHVVKSGKGKKIIVATYKPKKGEKRKLGHRQPYTKVEIKSIVG